MSTDGDMGERHGRVLAELAETGMVMVRRLSAAMLATDDVQTQAQLGLAYHRVSRAVRQTIALEFRLSQDARREDRPAPSRPTPPSEAAAPSPPRPQAERVGWNEYERDDSYEALEDLDVLLDAEDLDLDAVHEAVETCIARIRHDLDAEPMPGAGVTVLARPSPGRTRDRLLGSAALSPGPAIRPGPRTPSPWSGFG
ncbi:MAG: hypothetical protein KKE02_08145 [Alphaproteobacteria bacterium]|nr:hypothetical protein [Alphaproteobacteria bacterium]MBU1515683.1 hypothetical protein [Alphaproteobacteria bacterium]MBU2094942.1 hypothetical protein [Alphaproteobacteria bacterium]MBU2150974.1 hypothetical protein [Alphaproteobacteria bacterium]MBU2305951.1 hypothetical protein [Alphaproteobacteria bacterium]